MLLPMEQKDYLLREIEKIGLMLRMIISKLRLKGDNPVITMKTQFEEAKELMLQEAGFDIEEFLKLDINSVEQYMSKFAGFRTANIELLADVLKEMGVSSEPKMAKILWEKALRLYQICNSLDKTFSFERENKIDEIRNRI
jgi:uncharacterized protein YciU (UPF0263 family)